MSVVFVLLPLALLFVAVALAWFIWAVRSGQFEDLETPAVRILFDDEPSELSAPAVTDTSVDTKTAGGASAREVETR